MNHKDPIELKDSAQAFLNQVDYYKYMFQMEQKKRMEFERKITGYHHKCQDYKQKCKDKEKEVKITMPFHG